MSVSMEVYVLTNSLAYLYCTLVGDIVQRQWSYLQLQNECRGLSAHL